MAGLSFLIIYAYEKFKGGPRNEDEIELDKLRNIK